MKIVASLVTTVVFSLVLLTGCGGQGTSVPELPHANSAVPGVLRDLLVTVSTRPGATDPEDLPVISDAAQYAVSTFLERLGSDADLVQLSASITVELQRFSSYSAAVLASDPAADRALAVDTLIGGILRAGAAAGIDAEQFELAMLASAAAMETQLATALDSAAFELFRACWDAVALNMHQRNLLSLYPGAFSTLGVAAFFSSGLEQTVAMLEESLLAQLTGFEKAVHDSSVLRDDSYYINQQINLYAQNDLTMMRLGLELNIPVSSPDLDALISQMQALPAMAGVTMQTLVDSSVVELDAGNQPWLPLKNFVAYTWVQSQDAFHYVPAGGLDVLLQQMGESVPSAPGYSIFVNPYTSIFRLGYEAELGSLIISAEWSQAGDSANMVAPTLNELYQLRSNQLQYRDAIMAGISGCSPEEQRALAILLVSAR